MYRTDYEDIDLAPESIVAGIVASAAFDEEPELPDVAPFRHFWHAADADGGAEAPDVEPHVDESAPPGGRALRSGAWARHARGANGFGG